MAEVGWRDLQTTIVGGWEWKEKMLEKQVLQTLESLCVVSEKTWTSSPTHWGAMKEFNTQK